MSDEWAAISAQFGLPAGFGPILENEGQEKSTDNAKWLESGLSLLPKQLNFTGCHKKTVSCVAVEPSGARFITGSHDSSMAYWDWTTMTEKPFRLIEAMEGTALRTIQWSGDAKRILCAGGLVKARIFDRNGSMVCETGQGDRYLMDLRRTEGHVAALTAARWLEADSFVTAAVDGTIRRWKLTAGACRQERVILNGGKGRIPVCQLQIQPGRMLSACLNGILRVWSGDTQTASVQAHADYVTALTVRPGCEWQWATRSYDGTVKLWDLRNLVDPIATCNGLSCAQEETALTWSPTGDALLTGTSVRNGGSDRAELVSLDSSSLQVQERVSMLNASVVALEWHPRLDQLLVGHGNGTWSVLFDPVRSKRGALSIPNTRPVTDISTPTVGPIILPDADTIITEDERGGKYRDRRNPLKSRRPDLPLDGPSRQGKPGATTITQSIMKRVLPDRSRNEDPREALLKYARIAEEDPKFVTPAYQKTQPKPVFKKSDEGDK